LTIVQAGGKLDKEFKLVNMPDNLDRINTLIDFDPEKAGFRFYFAYFTDRGDQLF